MNALPPDHPPVKVASADTHHHSFWHDAGRWLGGYSCPDRSCCRCLCHPYGAGVISLTVRRLPWWWNLRWSRKRRDGRTCCGRSPAGNG